MRLMLCGGTGFIGNALAQALLERGDEVWIVTRQLPAAPVAGLLYATWEEWSQQPWQWNGIDAIVNLAGESVGKKWTEERKRQILISRTLTALRIEDIVRRMDQPPHILVNASGISIYGHSNSPLLKRQKLKALKKVRSALSEARKKLAERRRNAQHEQDELDGFPVPGIDNIDNSRDAGGAAFEPITAERVGIRGFSSAAKASRNDEREPTKQEPIEQESIEQEPIEWDSVGAEDSADPSDSFDSGADLAELLRKLRSEQSGQAETEADESDSFDFADELQEADIPWMRGQQRAEEQHLEHLQHLEFFDESSPANPEDYLGQVVVAWEEAVDRIPIERIVKLRISLVLGRDGGTFPLLRLPFRLFAGGRIGSGMQGFPWIHIDDMVNLILYSLDHPGLSGPLNAVAPDPVNNDEFGRTLAHVAGRPYWFHAPTALVEKALGEQSVLLLTGQHAYPRKALDYGFVFSYPRLEDALRDLLS
ncbi:epimerase [Cohnella fermenti]|uniref:DUF1731 domain-containing protein n=1 Tax=Cohnella fermenti TaxID=2565925 RepID=A0A4S4BJH9_9BACL|nr:DUF1731 domain-containing protein [Cohnella fermenti]THF74807.1 DUF1731 domain-containing protein [Cohnella fermenti]